MPAFGCARACVQACVRAGMLAGMHRLMVLRTTQAVHAGRGQRLLWWWAANCMPPPPHPAPGRRWTPAASSRSPPPPRPRVWPARLRTARAQGSRQPPCASVGACWHACMPDTHTHIHTRMQAVWSRVVCACAHTTQACGAGACMPPSPASAGARMYDAHVPSFTQPVHIASMEPSSTCVQVKGSAVP